MWLSMTLQSNHAEYPVTCKKKLLCSLKTISKINKNLRRYFLLKGLSKSFDEVMHYTTVYFQY